LSLTGKGERSTAFLDPFDALLEREKLEWTFVENCGRGLVKLKGGGVDQKNRGRRDH